MPRRLMFLLFLWMATLTGHGMAAEHVSCHRCKRLVKVTDRGAGYRREDPRIILCAQCIRDQFDPQEGEQLADVIKRHAFRGDEWKDFRYVVLADGTLIDMGHFFAAGWAANEFGPSEAMLVGWLVEVGQAFEEWINDKSYRSGYPMGGNEDLLSNTLGILYAAGVDAGAFTDQGTVTNYLELTIHGPVAYATDDKKAATTP